MSQVSPTVSQRLKEQQQAILEKRSKILKIKGAKPKKIVKKSPVKKSPVKKHSVKKVVSRKVKVATIEQSDIKQYVINLLKEEMSKLTGEEQTDRFDEYSKKLESGIAADNYYHTLAKLLIFLNKNDPIGQHAAFFQNKVVQGVYTPERVLELDLQEILPEVFLNPQVSEAERDALSKAVEKAISDKSASLEEEIHTEIEYMKDPSKKRAKKSAPAVAPPKIEKVMPVKEMCDNASWDIKAVNIIICKDGGKFYCLNIEKIIKELGTKGSATNYLTGKPLGEDVKSNLLKRYSNQIASKDFNIGEINNQDIVHLKKSQAILKEIQNNMKAGKDISAAVEKLPSLERDKVSAEWVEDNLKKMNPSKKATVVEEEPELVVKAHKETTTKEERKEAQVVAEQVLKKGTLAQKLFEAYRNRLDTIRDTIIKKMKDARDPSLRETFGKKLFEVSGLIEKLEKEMRTFDGIIARLEEEIAIKTAVMTNIGNAIGMNMIIPNELLLAQQEKENLQKQIADYTADLEYIKNLKLVTKKKETL